jgi:putative transcriptional regulator
MRHRKTTSAFEKIQAGLKDAIDYQRGKRVLTVRDVHLAEPAPMHSKEIVALRSRLNVSQAAFACLLNVSPRTVQAWERNARTPSDAALKLLHVVRRHPEVLLEGVEAAPYL